MKQFKLSILLISLLVLFGNNVGWADSKSGEQIKWQVISSGGTDGSSTNFELLGTISQTAIGPGSSPSFRINSGFWQNFEGGGTPGCCNTPGDASNNDAVNILDVTFLISYLYKGGPAPACMPEGDADGNGAINILDVTKLIGYLYKSGTPPICGPDPWP